MTSATLMTLEEAAEALRCTRANVRRMAASGRLRGAQVPAPVRGGRRWMIEQGAVVERVMFDADRSGRRRRLGGAS